jgi:hypothetical protein
MDFFPDFTIRLVGFQPTPVRLRAYVLKLFEQRLDSPPPWVDTHLTLPR